MASTETLPNFPTSDLPLPTTIRISTFVVVPPTTVIVTLPTPSIITPSIIIPPVVVLPSPSPIPSVVITTIPTIPSISPISPIPSLVVSPSQSLIQSVSPSLPNNPLFPTQFGPAASPSETFFPSARLSPTGSPGSSDSSNSGSSSSPSTVTTIAIVIGSLVFALFCAWVLHLFIRSRKSKSNRLALDEDLKDNIPNGNSNYGSNEPSTFTSLPRHPNMSLMASNSAVGAVSSAGAVGSVGAIGTSEYMVDRSLSQNTSQGSQISYGSTNLLISTTPSEMNLSPVPESSLYQVLSEYVPTRHDELHCRLGDTISVRQAFQDGWAFGKNMQTQEKGMFPLNFVIPVKPEA